MINTIIHSHMPPHTDADACPGGGAEGARPPLEIEKQKKRSSEQILS